MRLLLPLTALLLPGFVALAEPLPAPVTAALAAPRAYLRHHPEVGPPREAETALPRILSEEDILRYREIFALQEAGRLAEADRRVRELSDPLLMGHVLLQRYLHPRAYRSSWRELAAWLEGYADHPGADRIYKLALKRRPKGAAGPRAPRRESLPYFNIPGTAVEVYRSPRPRSPEVQRQVEKLKARIESNVLKDRLTVTEKLLASPETQRLLDRVEVDEGFTQVAAGWYFEGRPDRAFALAGQAAMRSGADYPLAHWVAGLAAWRLGDYAAAARHMGALAGARRVNGWRRSAAAYWAARASLRLERAAEMSSWLRIAAAEPRSFYGQIARQALGMPEPGPTARWAEEARLLSDLLSEPKARRAVALIEVGERALAEQELAGLEARGDEARSEALLILGERAGLPGFVYRLGVRLANGGREKDLAVPIEQALFPLPPWQPESGFRIDRALIYALMRQESGFDPEAKSAVGARGLMQIMPATARYIMGDPTLEKESDRLLDPRLNLELAQRYIIYLMQDSAVGQDLLRLAAAYNGGPGNLRKWQSEIEIAGPLEQDPLLFVESLPSRETRRFIEQVLANFWMYRKRLGQPVPSLKALAAGDWPVYEPLD